MKLRPEHFVEIISEAAPLSQLDASNYFLHKYNIHFFDNEHFKDELFIWLNNVYRMYKQHLYELKPNDPQKRVIKEMYIDRIQMSDMIEERFKPNKLMNSYYNKEIWGKLNNAYSIFLSLSKR
ncbi:MAG: hypothetical protein K2P88_04040 [Chitinophagaceae bacterium]|jgi:hypothetical protein|uniref:hypothetical protein n=1 Tax=unclassified Paraflavitalea TaxID=2798305 RepID=UPI003D33EAF5|nr:hypothetical protein [Chitinophagaceae bacterium]